MCSADGFGDLLDDFVLAATEFVPGAGGAAQQAQQGAADAWSEDDDAYSEVESYDEEESSYAGSEGAGAAGRGGVRSGLQQPPTQMGGRELFVTLCVWTCSTMILLQHIMQLCTDRSYRRCSQPPRRPRRQRGGAQRQAAGTAGQHCIDILARGAARPQKPADSHR